MFGFGPIKVIDRLCHYSRESEMGNGNGESVISPLILPTNNYPLTTDFSMSRQHIGWSKCTPELSSQLLSEQNIATEEVPTAETPLPSERFENRQGETGEGFFSQFSGASEGLAGVPARMIPTPRGSVTVLVITVLAALVAIWGNLNIKQRKWAAVLGSVLLVMIFAAGIAIALFKGGNETAEKQPQHEKYQYRGGNHSDKDENDRSKGPGFRNNENRYAGNSQNNLPSNSPLRGATVFPENNRSERNHAMSIEAPNVRRSAWDTPVNSTAEYQKPYAESVQPGYDSNRNRIAEDHYTDLVYGIDGGNHAPIRGNEGFAGFSTADGGYSSSGIRSNNFESPSALPPVYGNDGEFYIAENKVYSAGTRVRTPEYPEVIESPGTYLDPYRTASNTVEQPRVQPRPQNQPNQEFSQYDENLYRRGPAPELRDGRFDNSAPRREVQQYDDRAYQDYRNVPATRQNVNTQNTEFNRNPSPQLAQNRQNIDREFESEYFRQQREYLKQREAEKKQAQSSQQQYDRVYNPNQPQNQVYDQNNRNVYQNDYVPATHRAPAY